MIITIKSWRTVPSFLLSKHIKSDDQCSWSSVYKQYDVLNYPVHRASSLSLFLFAPVWVKFLDKKQCN